MGEHNGIVAEPDRTPLSAIEFAVLDACREAIQRQREILPLLARTLGVVEEEVFYTWAFRRCKQRWQLESTDWKCYFHGLECDLEHTGDGRSLRLDFGPGGRVDTCNAWAVLILIMTSTAPWQEYPDLKRQFAQPEPQTNRFGGNTKAVSAVWDRLAGRGAFQPADQELVTFMERHTTIGPDGLRYVRFPPNTPEKTQLDCSVAHRTILSPVGHQLLESHAARLTA